MTDGGTTATGGLFDSGGGVARPRESKGLDRLELPVAVVMLPPAAICLIAVLDAVAPSRAWPLPILGALDELSHLLTACLVLAAMPGRIVAPLWRWALLGSVVIDIDHVPLYWFAPEFEVDGRPPTHSLLTVAVLIVAALAVPMLRTPGCGLALGVGLHFIRDVATGPGVPLFWPISVSALRAPSAAYFGVLAILVVVDSWKIYRCRRSETGAWRF